jgi:GMP synthase-like glutamine amidotransferase
MITIFQHGPGEKPGYIIDLLNEKKEQYEILRLYRTPEIPLETESSHLIFLGGIMSVNDENEYPWLAREKQLIRDSLCTGTPILGICLGAQLIASALGEKVYPCIEEKGWFNLLKNNHNTFQGLGERITVFEWHNECFIPPAWSFLWYDGPTGNNQMFSLGSATGVQFHPEVTESIIEDWTRSEDTEIRENIRSDMSQNLPESMAVCRAIFNEFLIRDG